jgi:hypothetical protein
MNSRIIYILDTCALIHYFRGDAKLGGRARVILQDHTSCLVVPIYVFIEMKRLLADCLKSRRSCVRILPITSLRLAATSTNIKVFPRSPGVLVEEERLTQEKQNGLDEQDISICATALAIKNASTGAGAPIIVSNDGKMSKWGTRVGIKLVW